MQMLMDDLACRLEKEAARQQKSLNPSQNTAAGLSGIASPSPQSARRDSAENAPDQELLALKTGWLPSACLSSTSVLGSTVRSTARAAAAHAAVRHTGVAKLKVDGGLSAVTLTPSPASSATHCRTKLIR